MSHSGGGGCGEHRLAMDLCQSSCQRYLQLEGVIAQAQAGELADDLFGQEERSTRSEEEAGG